jgi:hypothetical protein
LDGKNHRLPCPDQEREAEAESNYRRALRIDEALLRPEHINVARDLSNLAGLLAKRNRTVEAEKHYTRALAIFKSHLGPDRPDPGGCQVSGRVELPRSGFVDRFSSIGLLASGTEQRS